MKTCHTCQQTYSDDVEFCPRDGARLAAQATETEAQLAAGLSRRFRIVRRLGQGGMGAVFLAEQIGVGNRPVALKVLNRKLLDDPDFLMRFQNEAGSTGRIHHANVVTIHESAQSDDGTPYIAMEFLEGESLRDTLKRRGALPVSEVAEILQQAARGLNAAHKLGIIHRDLKPDNIFLTYPDDESVAPATGEVGARHGVPLRPVDGTVAVASVSPPANVVVKIVDFGIAKLRESGAHTQTGMVLGTPAYMSFEQASGMRKSHGQNCADRGYPLPDQRRTYRTRRNDDGSVREVEREFECPLYYDFRWARVHFMPTIMKQTSESSGLNQKLKCERGSHGHAAIAR